MTPALTLLALAATASGPVGCDRADHVIIRVERVPPGSVDGIVVRVEAGGAPGGTADSVRSGRIRVCLPGVAPGDRVHVSLGEKGHRTFQLLFPPNGEVVIPRIGSPSVRICEVNKDCAYLSKRQVDQILSQALQHFRSTEEDLRRREVRFLGWVRSLQRRIETGLLVEALRRKERQLAVARESLELLSRFTVRALGVIESFRSHALKALDHGGEIQSAEIRDAIEEYRPVAYDLGEKGESNEMNIAEYWGPEQSERFRALLEEAKVIHVRITALNEVKELMNACLHRWSECSDRDAARRKVGDGVARIASDVKPRLREFVRRKRSFMDSLSADLFRAEPQDVSVSEIPPPRQPRVQGRRP
jgi:hypothetical protein